jgi:hypothetical protein
MLFFESANIVRPYRKKETFVMPILSAKETQGMRLPSPGPKEYWEDSEWAYEHMNEISEKYPNQWIVEKGIRVY